MTSTNKEQNINDPSDNSKRTFNKILTIFFGLFFVCIVFYIGYQIGSQNNAVRDTVREIPVTDAILANIDSDDRVDFKLFWRVWDIMRDRYVDRDDLDAQQMLYGAINGMLNASGDPYTSFLDPEQNHYLEEELNGSFEGIGAEIGIRENILTVIAPLKGSPAEQAGLRAGDLILEINGESTSELTIDEAVAQIRGEKGTEILFTIFREHEDDTLEITVVRDVIEIDSVTYEIKNDTIAYIGISEFSEDTFQELTRIAKEIIDNPAIESTVIDLRNNPGGLLQSSVDIASIMMEGGSVVVIQEDSNGKQTKLYTKSRDVLSGYDTVVLLNEGSASASEILAGALKENRDNVMIVGRTSFGKGSVQELVPLSDDSALKITIAKWLTPEGEQINKKGITPDVDVEITKEDYEAEHDPQLDRAIMILKGENGSDQ